MGIIVWLLVGLVAGWLAGLIMKGSGYGVIGDILLGLLGGVVGGWLMSVLLGTEPTGVVGSTLVAVLGAVVLVAISRMVTGRPVRT